MTDSLITSTPRRRISRRDIDHCFDYDGVILSPFYFLVSVDDPLDDQAWALFDIMRLPVELHYEILNNCNPATLFQLMHTNSYFRQLAGKLFWSHPEPWYHCEAYWLTAHQASPGLKFHCPDFASLVQQVSVYFNETASPFDSPSDPRFYDHAYVDDHRRRQNWIHEIQSFWRHFRSSFPSARRLLFSSRSPNDRGLLSHFDAVFDIAPSNLDILFMSPEFDTHCVRPSSTLWSPRKQLDTNKVDWTRLSQDSQEHRVLMPTKKVTGLAGSILGFRNRFKCLDMECNAIRDCIMRAHEETLFNSPTTQEVECLRDGCDMTFTERGQYTTHAERLLHHFNDDDRSFAQFKLTDAVFQRWMTLMRALCHTDEEVTQQWRTLHDSFGARHTDQWRATREALLTQLQCDPAFVQNMLELDDHCFVKIFDGKDNIKPHTTYDF